MFNTLKLEMANNIATISLNRPDRYNAFNEELSYELQDALKKVSRDRDVRVVVLTGEGKAFCSGQDLKDIQGKKRKLSESLYKRYNPIIKAIREMEKPVICRLNGVGAGAGCSLALACDMVIASEKASLIEVFVNVGLVPDSGSSWFLPRLVGYSKAFELAAMGSKVTAQEALQLGLVNRVVPEDELDDAVSKVTTYFANAPTKAIGMMKKMLNKAYRHSLEEQLQYEAWCQEIAGDSADYQEGVEAFVNKRKPEFKGE